MSNACPACGHTESTVFTKNPQDVEYFVHRKMPAVVRRCSDCRSLFQDPWPSEAETSAFYGPHYNYYAGSKVPLLSQLHFAQNRMEAQRLTARYGRDARILDFGCGHCSLLNALKSIGSNNICGFDFLPERPSPLAEGIPYYGSEAELAAAGQTYDVIRLNHVIEHLTDYDGTLGLLRGLLADGGSLIGQTPNGGHYTSTILGRRWGNLHYPYHTLLLSHKGMRALAARTGFKVVEIEKTMMPTGVAMGVENAIKGATDWKAMGRTPIYTLLIAAATPLAIHDRFAPWAETNIMNFRWVAA